MSAFVVTLQGGAPWGLRLQGGSGTGEPLRIAKINPGSKASRAQLHVGDVVETVNGVRTANLPVNQAQKLLHNNSNDLQLRIHRNQLSVNGSYHPNGKMSSQSSLIVTNDSGFSGTDDRRLVRKPSQDDVIHLDGVTLQGFDPGSVSVVRTTTTKVTKTTRSRSPSPVTVRRLSSDSSPRLGRSGSTPGRIRMRVVPSGHDSESEPGEVILPTFATGVTCSSPTRKGSPTSPPMSPTNGFPMSPSEQKGAPPPPVVDIPNNNNNLRKDEDEFWPPPPPPDESIWSPSKDGPSVDHVADQMAPPPPPVKEDDGGIAPVWTPGGVPAVKKEFKPVKLDLNRPKTSTVKQPTYSSSSTPAAHTWNPPNKGPTSPKPVTPQSPYAQPMAVDTLPDPSHILSPSYVSPRSPIQQPHPPPPPQFAGDGSVSPHPPASSPGGRPVPASPAGAVPYQSGGLPQYEGMANGYGFIPASAVMSGSPGAFQSGLLTFATPSGPALPSTNDNSTIILDPANLPPGALFQKQTIDGDVVHTDTFYPVQGVTRKTSTVTKHDKPNYEGIGPRDKDGLPLGLRQHVKEDNRHDWYKEMFKSIHKQDRDDDDSSDSVFMSESEVMHAQDDWKTVDRDNEPEKVVKNKPSYRVQPGRITDFVPGKSALAAHEKSLQSRKDGPLYDGSRRGSAPGSGYASDEEARKAYHSFIKSGELPSTAGFGFGAPPARRAMDISFPTNSFPKHHMHVVGSQKFVDGVSGFPSLTHSSIVYVKGCSDRRSRMDVAKLLGEAITPTCMPMSSTMIESVCCDKAEKDVTSCVIDQKGMDAGSSEMSRFLAELFGHEEKLELISSYCSMKHNAVKESSIMKPPAVFRKPRLDVGGSPLPHPVPVMPTNEDKEEEEEETSYKGSSRPSRIQYRINSSREKVKHKRSSSAPRSFSSTADGDGQGRKPMYHRSASSSGSTPGLVRSPAADQESYQKYATGLQQASQRTQSYQNLVNFYSNLNKHLDESEKKKAQTLAEKYMPSSQQLEKFYSTLHLYMEMEMAAAHGQTFVNDSFDELRWSMDKEKDFKNRELNIDDLHSFYTKLNCGLNVDKKSEEKLEKLKKKMYADKMKQVSQKEKDVAQLNELYEGIASGRSTPVPKSPVRKAISLPSTPVRHRTPVSWEKEEEDVEHHERPSEPEPLPDVEKTPAVRKVHSVDQETEVVPPKTESTESRPQFTRCLSEPNWRSKLANRYNQSIYEEDLLLMPALLKDMHQWEQFSSRERGDLQDRIPKSTSSGNESKPNQSELKCKFVSPSEVEVSHSDWNMSGSPNPVQSAKEGLGNSAPHQSTYRAKQHDSQRSQESDASVQGNSSGRLYYQSSSFEQDTSPLTLRSKPMNTAEVKPFQWSEDQSDSYSAILPDISGPGSAPRMASSSSHTGGQREHRDFNPRPQPFSSSPAVGSDIVVVTAASSLLSSPVVNTKQNTDSSAPAIEPSDLTDQLEHSPSLDRANLNLPIRSLSMPESTPSVVVHTPSSEEDEWLETYDKVRSSWEESISAFESRKQEKECDNGSSQAEGSVHSIGGVDGAQSSDLSHWNMDDDLLSRSLPRNFKLSYGKEHAKLIRQDAKAKPDDGSWEVFTEPQEDELYKTTPSTAGPFDGTVPLETDIKIPRKLIKAKHVEKKMTPSKNQKGKDIKEVKSVQESLRNLTQLDPEPVLTERPSSSTRNRIETTASSNASDQPQSLQVSAITSKALPHQSAKCEDDDSQREKMLWKSHAEKGPPPPYNPDWSRKQSHSSARSSPVPRQQRRSVRSRVPVKAELKERIPATRKNHQRRTDPGNFPNQSVERKVRRYKEAAGNFSRPPSYEQGIRRSQSLTAKGSLLGYPIRSTQSYEEMNMPVPKTASGEIKVRDIKGTQPMEQVPRVYSSSVSHETHHQASRNSITSTSWERRVEHSHQETPNRGRMERKQEPAMNRVDRYVSRFNELSHHSQSRRVGNNKDSYSSQEIHEQDQMDSMPGEQVPQLRTNVETNRDSWSVSEQSSPSYSIADSDQLPPKNATKTTEWQHYKASGAHGRVPDPYHQSVSQSHEVQSHPSFGVARSRQLPPFYTSRENEGYSQSQSIRPTSPQQSRGNYIVDDDTGEAYYRSSSSNPPDAFDDDDDPYDDPYLYPEPKTSTAGPIQPSLQQPSYQEPPPTSTSSISSPSALSPALHGGVPSSVGSAAGVVPTTTLTRSASLPRSTGLPKRRQRYSEGSGLSAAERLGIKTPPPARLSASATTKPVVQDSRYDYLSQFPSTERQISEKKPRQVREPDASYNKSLPEYLPIKSPSITDDRFDDFDFTPPVTVPAAKQELTRASAIGLYPFTAQSKKELSFKKGDTIYLTREIDKNWLEGEHHGNKGIFPRTYVEIVTSLEEARNLQVNTPSSEGKGRAKYRFKGETANELSVNKGEIVDLIRKIDANWWEVRHGNKAGIVPVAYLDVLREPQQGLSSPQPRSPMPKSPLSPGAGRGPLSPSQQAPRSPPVNRRDNYQPSSPYQTDMPSQGRQQPSQQNRVGQGPRAGSGSGGRGVQQAGGRPAQNAGFHPKRPDGERYRAVYSYQPSNDDELEIMEGETVVVMEKCDDGWYVGFSESTGQFGTFPGNYVEKL